MDMLRRDHADLPASLWRDIEEAAVAAARERLTGRRFLELQGPFGLGLTSIEVGDDEYSRAPEPDEAGAIIGRALPVPMLRKSFRLSLRRVAAALENGQPLDLTPAEDAAEAVANREEEFIYYGEPERHVAGLLTVAGRHQIEGGDWSSLDRALADVLQGVTMLDEAGYRGPYALALAPALYNGLFRIYPGSDVLQLEHLRRLCTRGIFKAPIEGGVLVDPNVGVLVLGQDLSVGYASQDGVHLHLFVSESIVLRIDEPQAICTLGEPTPPTKPRAARSGG
jgi:uncharacterized linocin/CFP29 family protein